MKRDRLTLERVRQMLDYDPSTGVFTWKVSRRGQAHPGDTAGYTDKAGYVSVCIDGVLVKAHRLVWFYVFGEWPRQEIDHRDANTGNNRLGNLRDVSPRVNRENRRRADHDSTSGLLGVTPHGRGFMAQIAASGRHFYLGTHDTPEQAHEAYVTAKRELHEGCTL